MYRRYSNPLYSRNYNGEYIFRETTPLEKLEVRGMKPCRECTWTRGFVVKMCEFHKNLLGNFVEEVQ